MPSVSFTVRAVLPQDIDALCSLRRLLWQNESDDDHIFAIQQLLAEQHRYATFAVMKRLGIQYRSIKTHYNAPCPVYQAMLNVE